MTANVCNVLARSVPLESIRLVRSVVPPGTNLSIRPVFVVLAGSFIASLAVLALASLPPLGLDDKIQHFLGNAIATALVYPIVDPPPTPKVLTYLPVACTLFVNGLCLGVLSEFVQDWFTTSARAFDGHDILANLAGLALALPLSYRYWSYPSPVDPAGDGHGQGQQQGQHDEERDILLDTVS